jgi:hypothetical protein
MIWKNKDIYLRNNASNHPVYGRHIACKTDPVYMHIKGELPTLYDYMTVWLYEGFERRNSAALLTLKQSLVYYLG